MRAYMLRTGSTISPFLDAPEQSAYAGSTVWPYLLEKLRRRGIELSLVDALPAIDAPTLVLADHTFVSDKCVADFCRTALPHVSRGPLRLALAHTPSAAFTQAVSSVAIEPFDVDGPGQKPKDGFGKEAEATERVAYDCFLVTAHPGGPAAGVLEALRSNATRAVVKKRELGIAVRMPTLGDENATKTTMPITSTVACHLEHWVHILWLNQLAWGITMMELVREHPLWTLSRLVLAFPWTSSHHFFRAFVKKGKNVRIHKTASVEASILGDDVVIGARASVRNSILGHGVEIGDHATVLSSTLGNDSYVTPKTFVVWCATYARAVLQNLKLQVSVIGAGASLSTWAGLIDAKLQGAVDVRHRGKTVSTGKSFLGSCVGHGAHVGAKVIILPGREVPNGMHITMRPDELVTDIPVDLPRGVPVVREQGTLVPVTALLPQTSSHSA